MKQNSFIMKPWLRVIIIAVLTACALTSLILFSYYHRGLSQLDDMNDFDVNYLISLSAASIESAAITHSDENTENIQAIEQGIKTLTRFKYVNRPTLFVELIRLNSSDDENKFSRLSIHGLNPSQSQRGFIEIDDKQFRARALLVSNSKALIIGRSVEILYQQLITLSLIIVLTTLTATLFCYLYLTRHQQDLNQRVSNLCKYAQSVGQGRASLKLQSQKFQSSERNDELDKIFSAIESMAANIERRMKEHRQFSEKLAHELRMPLARLSASLAASDDANSKQKTNAVTQRIQEISLALQDMLEIASINNEKDQVKDLNKHSLHDTLVEAWQIFEDIADENEIRVEFDPTKINNEIMCHEALFRRLLINMFDNALKNCQAHGTIIIESDLSKGVVITVKNTGNIFPTELTDKSNIELFALNRFDGHGMGLAFIQAISTYHNWQLNLSNEGEYACVRVTL